MKQIGNVIHWLAKVMMMHEEPHFESGVILEPSLLFGGQHTHPDPKTGLSLYGPYTPKDQLSTQPNAINIGIIGPPDLVGNAEHFLSAFQSPLKNSGKEPFLYPPFPGFNSDYPFQCELRFGKAWFESIKKEQFEKALQPSHIHERIKQVVQLFTRGVETLTQLEQKPDVILCCIPDYVITVCTEQITRAGKVRRRGYTPLEKKDRKRFKQKRMHPLFQEMDPTIDIECGEGIHKNLRRAIKAEIMNIKNPVPTQLIWPRTMQLAEALEIKPGEHRLQDIASRAWNLGVAIYYKGKGLPWRIANMDSDICFVGISFYKEISTNNPKLHTSMAQTFTAKGDGYVLRGGSVDWDERKGDKTPHLKYDSAGDLIVKVLNLYKRHHDNRLPRKLVIHKTSKFWEDELNGFKDAAKEVERRDFVTIGKRGVQFYRKGDYPPLRGTYIKFSESSMLLYTSGYIPYLKSYPGPRTPWPIDIVEHHGDSSWREVLEEILALTKMNWNCADFACSLPITIAFAQKVGEILAELPPGLKEKNEYRFYM